MAPRIDTKNSLISTRDGLSAGAPTDQFPVADATVKALADQGILDFVGFGSVGSEPAYDGSSNNGVDLFFATDMHQIRANRGAGWEDATKQDIWLHQRRNCLPNTTYTDLNMLPFGKATTIAPLNGHCSCAGATWSIVAGSEVNIASVAINPDGTHTVEPDPAACAAGGWSYDYKETCPDGTEATATVSGIIDTTKVEIARFSTDQAAGSQINLSLVMQLGGTFSIDWDDDGTMDVVDAASSAAYQSHTYASAYKGDVVVYASACEAIKEIRSNQGSWDFDLVDLPSGLTYLRVRGQNTISGPTTDLPSGLTYLLVTGQNTISGPTTDLPSGLTYLLVTGQNTISGPTSDLPSGLTYLNVNGQNTISGPTTDLPSGLTYLRVIGQNTISGPTSDLPRGLTCLRVRGQNTISGPTTDLPSGLTYLLVTGQNTISGPTTDLPSGLTYLNVQGQNTISGPTTDLPSGLTYLLVTGQNTISGPTTDLPSGLTYLNVEGQNTISGPTTDLPSGLTYLRVTGQNTISVPSDAWPMAISGFRYLLIHGQPKSQTEVDNLLQAATNVTSWASEKYVNVAGSNAAPSATGTAAANTILANGATTVITN